MKNIVLILIVTMMVPASISVVSATSPQLSLTTQMTKQEQINRKNDLSTRLREQARLRQAAKDRVQALKNKKNITNNLGVITPVINPIQWSTPLSLKHPPEIISSQPTHTIPSVPHIISPRNLDINQVINTWLSWTNSVRLEQWLSPYTIDTRLNGTAQEWSEYSKNRGYIIHGRPGDGCNTIGNYSCYNFSAIDTWFKARGIDPIVINRTKHTENIGTRGYGCHSSNCTDEMIIAVRKTFDFFLSEKSYNGVHYKSLVNPLFTKIWAWVSVDESKWVYYLTVHYITK